MGGTGISGKRRSRFACFVDRGVEYQGSGYYALMRALVGVTDNDWAAFLRARPHITEANFWLPSGLRGFKALSSGEAFAFKTHYPDNKIVGGGFLSGVVDLRVSEAWEVFGEANGVPSRQALLHAINHYRVKAQHLPTDPDPVIGCVLLRDTYFAPHELAWDGPPDFAKSVVRWKGYDLGSESGSYVQQALAELLATSRAVARVDGPMFGDPRLVTPRLGQCAFKSMVSVAYHRRCAVTGNRVLPVLQAAHIRPVTSDGEHRLDNGLLLRSDAHILFDRGYLGIDDKYRLHVSPRLRSDFDNGDEFYVRDGQEIRLPDNLHDRPRQEFIEWHMDEVFLAS